MDYFSKEKSWQQLLDSNGEVGDSHLYWLNADRTSWRTWDTVYLSEATVAIANMLCLMRTTYMLAASELLGPLLISLKHMLKVGYQDVIRYGNVVSFYHANSKSGGPRYTM